MLRKAFTDMINDAAFRADAEKRGAVLAMSGVADIVRTPSDIIRKTNEVTATR